MGRARDRRAADRHVRLRRVRPQGAQAKPGARPARHQAALLGTAEWPHRFRLRAEGVRGASRVAPRDRSRRARVISPLRLCAVAAFDLPRHRQACAGHRRQHRGRWQVRSLDLLEPDGRRHAGQGGASRSWRGRSDGCAGIAAWRCGAAAAGLGCAARRVSLRRHRFIDRRGHDARAQQCAGQDLFHRLRREGL